MAVIKDVARLAGVSTATVSKVINNPSRVRKETRLKVQRAMEELNYCPSPLAQSMRTGRTNTIAVVSQDIVNPFFAEAFAAIRNHALNSGLNTILYTPENTQDIMTYFTTKISISHVDGIILCFVDEYKELNEIIQQRDIGVPLVVIGWRMGNPKFDSIVVDVFDGMYKVTQHLIQRGHTNIGYIGGPRDSLISREKYLGYKRAMDDAGLKVRDGFVASGDYTLLTGYLAAREFTMAGDHPTALIGANDILAIGCIKYLLSRDLKVPDDIAVAGFDNISLSAMYQPSVTTAAVPLDTIAREGIALLKARMGTGDGRITQLIVNTNLCIRNSTDKEVPIGFYSNNE